MTNKSVWPSDAELPVIPLSTIARHNTEKDCWVVLHGRVYDLTAFLPHHPGGKRVILNQAGKDGTKAFDLVHPPDIMRRLLTPDVLVGRVDPKELEIAASESESDEDKRIRLAREKLPPLSSILNLMDFEALAPSVMHPEAFAYYSSAADDELTLRENRAAFLRCWLVPRVMRNVRSVNTSCVILGTKCSFPIYVSATALGKLGNPEGEVVLTRACATRNVPQMLPTLASCSLDEMIDARQDGQVQWFQLYVNQDRNVTKQLVQHAEQRGCQALFITVDAPQLGKREKDMRMKFKEEAPDVQTEKGLATREQGAARAISSFIDPGLCWDDLTWFKSITKLPIILKGVQCVQDAVTAFEQGCAGIVLSNHGGRQLDTARSALEVLPEVVHEIRVKRGIHKSQFGILLDGGVRRGADIFKAMALGADGVGIGRPFLYAMSTYGQAGVEHAMDVLKDELELTMRLMGVTKWEEVERDMVCTQSLRQHVVPVARDMMTEETYIPLLPPKPKL